MNLRFVDWTQSSALTWGSGSELPLRPQRSGGVTGSPRALLRSLALVLAVGALLVGCGSSGGKSTKDMGTHADTGPGQTDGPPTADKVGGGDMVQMDAPKAQCATSEDCSNGQICVMQKCVTPDMSGPPDMPPPPPPV